MTPHLCLLVSYILTSYSTISYYRLMGGGDSRHSQQNIEDANVGPIWARYGLPMRGPYVFFQMGSMWAAHMNLTWDQYGSHIASTWVL